MSIRANRPTLAPFEGVTNIRNLPASIHQITDALSPLFVREEKFTRNGGPEPHAKTEDTLTCWYALDDVATFGKGPFQYNRIAIKGLRVANEKGTFSSERNQIQVSHVPDPEAGYGTTLLGLQVADIRFDVDTIGDVPSQQFAINGVDVKRELGVSGPVADIDRLVRRSAHYDIALTAVGITAQALSYGVGLRCPRPEGLQ